MTNELLTAAYNKIADALIATKYENHSLKQSNAKFRIYEGSKIHNETWAYRLDFEKSFEFSYGNWKTFYFNSKEALGKFLFETQMNNGMPKDAIRIKED